MNRYRKKTVVIEAFQMTKKRRESNIDWPNWLNKAWDQPTGAINSVWCVKYPLSDGKDNLAIGTLKGVTVVDWGDYIIQGVKGEIYACKPDIFEMTYEKLEK